MSRAVKIVVFLGEANDLIQRSNLQLPVPAQFDDKDTKRTPNRMKDRQTPHGVVGLDRDGFLPQEVEETSNRGGLGPLVFISHTTACFEAAQRRIFIAFET